MRGAKPCAIFGQLRLELRTGALYHGVYLAAGQYLQGSRQTLGSAEARLGFALPAGDQMFTAPFLPLAAANVSATA